MRFRTPLLATLTSCVALAAEVPEYVLVADYYSGLKEVDLKSLQIDVDALGPELPGTFLGFEVDLNDDSVPEHVLRGRQEDCGTGGCTLWIIDGKSKAPIASLFGRPLIVHSVKINGWPVLSIYAHQSATSGTLVTQVYDGTHYQEVSTVTLYDQSVSDLFKKLESAPTILTRQMKRTLVPNRVLPGQIGDSGRGPARGPVYVRF